MNTPILKDEKMLYSLLTHNCRQNTVAKLFVVRQFNQNDTEVSKHETAVNAIAYSPSITACTSHKQGP
ncbi:hypothetical protein KIN20_019228 [Parelaphostrongylus tenuis]|uniref:Uncharacterized protein n=1 Tax=Parelaphostrongylus tenuis TaxID=148309 RepID=A0AAD5QSP3_PARTN|nr:hypothetical protein KIN20_019228 [Parelaphostrongylus tenuis]